MGCVFLLYVPACDQRLRKEQDTVIRKINKIHSKLSETLKEGMNLPHMRNYFSVILMIWIISLAVVLFV